MSIGELLVIGAVVLLIPVLFGFVGLLTWSYIVRKIIKELK